MTGPNLVEQYWTGVASQLQVEANVFNRLIGHNGEMGRANELALARLVSSLLPASLGVGTGLVIDSDGGSSNQSDLIIYDLATQPQVLAQSTQLLFPVETVLAVIEIKTTIDAEAIRDAAGKFENLRNLKAIAGRLPPLAVLFGYRVGSGPSARAQELNALRHPRHVDVAAVLDPGLVSRRDDDGLNMGMVPLHELDVSGTRRSGTWIPATGQDEFVIRGNQSFPVARFDLYGDRFVFEPGRALLLFAEQLLTALAQRSRLVDTGWLSAYLPAVARETVTPG